MTPQFRILGCFILLFFSPVARSSDLGTLEGTVRDVSTLSPLVGAHVRLVGTTSGAATDLEGRFRLTGLAPGNYSLRFSHVGYEPFVRTDVIVRPGRITTVHADLAPSPYETDEVEATPGYFATGDPTRLSAVSFSAEEVRRAPGAAGDVSRIMISLPSVAKVNDQSNGLIVRGGSPLENAFIVDDMEIPNINHFPTQGASSGPIGLINIDLVNDVRFSAGGFDARYGDRLSSVMELGLREGNRSTFEAQLDLNFLGFGGVAEGPIGTSGSWLLSVRRSYLDLIMKMVDIGTSVTPRYGDLQGKAVIDLGPRHRLELLGIWSDDHNNPDAAAALEYDMTAYGREDITQHTTGIGWRALWSNGVSNTTVSLSSSHFERAFNETGTDLPIISNDSEESILSLRNVNHVRLSSILSLEFGAEGKLLTADYDQIYSPITDPFGGSTPGTTVRTLFHARQAGSFISVEISLTTALSITAGLRADYFSPTGRLEFSPRFSSALRVGESTTLSAGIGLYRQNLPLLLLTQDPANASLRTPQAVQATVGVEQLLTPSTRLTVEAYIKEFHHLPGDPSQPRLFIVDELYYGYGFFTQHGALADDGRARSRGVEVVVQKKLAEDLYGLASASWSRSEYQDGLGTWVDRLCDNRVILAIEGGYKPNSEWEFSARWIFAGGAPYTPFDPVQSAAQRRGILDAGRVNALRYPDYHSLNIRCDRRFHFTSSNLVFYLSAWNLYQRKNVASYFWKPRTNEQGTITQWGLLPVFGLEYEF